MQETKDMFEDAANALLAEIDFPRKKSTTTTSKQSSKKPNGSAKGTKGSRRSLKKRKGYAKAVKPPSEPKSAFEQKVDNLYDDRATNADVRLREFMLGQRSFIDRHGVETWYKPKEGRQYTLEEIGTIMGVTRERVRQVEEIALRKMWKHIRSMNMREDLTETDWLGVLKQNDDKDRSIYFPGTI